MNKEKKRFLLFLLLLVLFITGCGNPGITETAEAIDYQEAGQWLSAPASPDMAADVFYLYPTVWGKTDEDEPNLCAIDHPMMRQMAPIAFAGQASVFEPIANIYCPFYRQVDAGYLLSLSPEEREVCEEEVSVDDATAAFAYYIDNFNDGRPFFLAGHSQGSFVLERILADYMPKHPEVYNRMIAAYVIGYSVTEEYLAENPHLKFAQRADDTGVIISYNTEAPGIEAENGVILPGALVINPITWTTEETLAAADKNLGSVLMNKDRTLVLDEDGDPLCVRNYADAQIDQSRGALICSTADVEELAPGNARFAKGIFHVYDYAFYYFNLRENAAVRLAAYLNQQP